MNQMFHKPSSTNEERLLKKRKHTVSIRTSSSEDFDLDESKKCKSMDINCKRQIHSNIEKRRRDKMNDYIAQLSTMIPTYNSNVSKLDKITVLKMAVQYLRSIRNSPVHFGLKENLKYSFVNDLELKKLMQQYISGGFLFVVSCESTRILYVSKSVSNVLSFKPTDLEGCSLYDIIHPNDMDKVKEQISCVYLNSKHQLDSIKLSKNHKVDLPGEQLGAHPGNRRSFFFRIKNHIEESNKWSTNDAHFPFNGFNNTNENNDFTLIQCNGYLKYANSINCASEGLVKSDNATTKVSTFVAICRTINGLLPKDRAYNNEPITFISKHAVDGKFLFVENGATIAIGYLPQEMIGTNVYDYLHPEDINDFATTHQSMLQFPSGSAMSHKYRIRSKCGIYVELRSEWKTLVNPWKNEVEYYYAKSTIIPSDKNTRVTAEKQRESTCLYEPDDLYAPAAEEQEQNDYHNVDFGFESINCGKFDNMDNSMDAFLKLLEYDASVA